MSYFSDRQGKKLAGVAATFGEVFNIDPIFIRIGFVATALLISWKLALVAYIAGGTYLHMARRDALRRGSRPGASKENNYRAPRASVHDLRTKLDTNDRRLMAIDHHLHTQNDELARSIEALREKNHA